MHETHTKQEKEKGIEKERKKRIQTVLDCAIGMYVEVRVLESESKLFD